MSEPVTTAIPERGLVRRQFLKTAGLAGAAGAAAALAAHTSALAATDGSALTGSWVETITSTDGSFPPFTVLVTYAAGGGLVATASIDSTPRLKSSPTHGAWRSSGGSDYKWTGHAFSFNDSGHPNGTYNIIENLTLNGDGYSGSGTFEVVGGPGAVLLTPYKTSAVRVTT